MNKRFEVISHTHWDREWYLTFDQFRFRLVALMDNLIELLEKDEAFRVFHLDGQTIVLEDYLEIRPGQKERLERLIRSGRLLIGPWYLQNDGFLTSGEATVRNLQLGIRQSRQISREMKVGYLPDQFGNISQMPQILQGFGIDNVVFGRGYDISKHSDQEFLWEGADGTRVTAVFMPNWYNNAQRFPEDPEKALKVLRHAQKNIDRYRRTGHYLLMNGVDHLEAQENLSGILEGLRKRLPEDEEIVHATLEEHIEAVKKELTDPKVQYGEMRSGDDYHILAGTLSSRVYLKQANARLLDLLEKWLEPLSAWLSVAGLAAYPEDYLQYLWKELMKNHPHDSICGCSQDEVHQHMMDRFRRVEEAGEELYKKLAGTLIRQIDRTGMADDDQLLTVLNPAPGVQSGWVETTVDFQEKDEIGSFELRDAGNRKVPFEVMRKEKVRKQRLSPINLPTELPVDRFHIGFFADGIPGQGYTSCRIVPKRGETSEPNPDTLRKEAGPVLENEHLRVEVAANGSLTVTDKASGQTFPNWMSFVDEGDGGDLYVYKSVAGSEAVTNGGVKASARLSVSTEHYTSWEVTIPFQLPSGLTADRTARSEETCSFTVKATVSLAKGARHIEVKAQLDNVARDHRLRVRFPLIEPASETFGGGQFDIVKRPASTGSEYQRFANSQPNWKWAGAGSGGIGVALFNRGLTEYELRDGGKWLELTLLRSVGTIFGIGDSLPNENDDNPLGQCPGHHVFEFAIRPFGPDARPVCIAREAEAYHHGLRTAAIPVREDLWAPGRPWVQDSEITELFRRPDPNDLTPRLPREHSFVTLQGDGVVLSAVKRAWSRDAYAVRFYNGEDSATHAVLSFDRPIRRAFHANLMEEPAVELPVERGTVSLDVKPKEIVTLLLYV